MKIKKIVVSFILAIVAMVTFVSCSTNKSGITENSLAIDIVKTSKSVKFTVTADKNEYLDEGTAKIHVKQYKFENGTETYSSVDNNLSISASTHTGTVEFTGLSASTTYRFKFFVTFSGTDSLITTKEVVTNSASSDKDSAIHISTKEDFEKIVNDPTAYYILDADIEYGTKGENETYTPSTLPSMFTSSTQFKGTFDGNGHKITNYKLISAEYTGLFAYASGATIKNLTVENVVADFTGRSSTKCGALVGYAERTLIENCVVNKASIAYASNSSSSESYFGAIIGKGVTVSIIDCKANDIHMNMTQSRLKLSYGLLAGSLEDNGLVTKDNVNLTVKNSHVNGSIDVVTYYNTSSTGYLAVGGFIGNSNTSGLITESSADADITVSKADTTYTDSFNLYVGGFIGTNNVKTINVTKCLSVSKIRVYAGKLVVDDNGTPIDADYSANKMTRGEITSSSGEVTATYFTYLGGFVGRIQGSIDKIDNCYALLKAPIYFTGKLDNSVVLDKTISESDEEGKARIKIVSNQTSDSSIIFTTTNNADQTVYYSTNDKIALGTELNVKVNNGSSKTLLLTIKVGTDEKVIEVKAKESVSEVVALTDNAVFALEQKLTLNKYVYSENFAGLLGNSKARVTNCHTNLDDVDKEISEELYNLFKETVDKYRN